MKLRKYMKNPIWPALLSALVAPGVGQLLNRHILKAVGLFTVFMGGFVWFYVVLTKQLARYLVGPPDQWSQNVTLLKEATMKIVTENPGFFATFYLLMGTVWVYGVLDAYLSARSRLKHRLP